MNLRQTLLMFIAVLTACFLCFSVWGQTNAGMIAHFKFSGNAGNTGPANVRPVLLVRVTAPTMPGHLIPLYNLAAT